MKTWDAKELITKYPIKNVWEWEFSKRNNFQKKII